MRTLVLLIAMLAVGCGDKTPPTPAAEAGPSDAVASEVDPASEPVAEEPVAEEPMVAEAPPTPSATPNADFQATLTYGDGKTISGHVVRVERGEDWYAEQGWTDRDVKLTVSLEKDGAAIDARWTDISRIDIRYKPRSEVSCLYDSATQPWTYMCVLPTESTVSTTDGKTWEAASRHRWRFTFEDRTSAEFYVYKLPSREQDTEGGGITSSENTAMYAKLQDAVAIEAKTALTRIQISQ